MNNTQIVLLRGINDDEIVPLFEQARTVGAEIRYIEYMDVGGATQWSLDKVVPASEILAVLERAYGPARRVDVDADHAVAEVGEARARDSS